MAHHTILFAEKNLKKLIVYAGTNGNYRNIDTSGNYEKIYNYVKANASKTELSFSEICCRGDRRGVMNELKTLNKKIEEFCKSKNLALLDTVMLIKTVCQRKNYDYIKREFQLWQ